MSYTREHGRPALLALALLVPSLACAGKPASEKPMKQATPPTVEIKLSGLRMQRPPKVRLDLDVVLRNPGAEARWFVLPGQLPVSSSPGGVDVLEEHAQGDPALVIGRFLGTGGFTALRLPASGEVHVKALPLAFWGELPTDKITFEVVIARDVTLGGEPAAKWFSADPTTSLKAEGNGAGTLRASHRSTGDEEVTVAFTGATRVPVTVEIAGH